MTIKAFRFLMLTEMSGIKKITDLKQKEERIVGTLDTANEMNTFFNRFSS